MEEARKAFEETWKDYPECLSVGADGDYIQLPVLMGWEAWQEAWVAAQKHTFDLILRAVDDKFQSWAGVDGSKAVAAEEIEDAINALRRAEGLTGC